MIEVNCAVNSKAFLVDSPGEPTGFVGNRTECSLLMMLRGWGVEYSSLREDHESSIIKLYAFSSERKMSSVLLQHGQGARLFAKVLLVMWVWGGVVHGWT